MPAKKKLDKAKTVTAVRKLALGFPDATERPSHGAPAWFVGKKQFASLADNHHGDGEFALWLAAPDGAQEMLIDSEPDHFYRPAYVGHLGWVARQSAMGHGRERDRECLSHARWQEAARRARR